MLSLASIGGVAFAAVALAWLAGRDGADRDWPALLFVTFILTATTATFLFARPRP